MGQRLLFVLELGQGPINGLLSINNSWAQFGSVWGRQNFTRPVNFQCNDIMICLVSLIMIYNVLTKRVIVSCKRDKMHDNRVRVSK